MSEADIQRMVKEAQEHEAEDKARREAIDARNQLESLVLGVGKHFDENKDKVAEPDRGELEAALKEGRDILEANKEPKDGAIFKTAHERLQKASHKMAETLYQAASNASSEAPGSTPPSGDDGKSSGGKDDVIDAEYTEGPK
jgi:molecular chaperone DnaK